MGESDAPFSPGLQLRTLTDGCRRRTTRGNETQRSYYDADFRQGQSMIRARRPFVVKNALTGLAILGFTGCVCTLFPDPGGRLAGVR